MAQIQDQASELKMELTMSRLLRAGVVVCCTIMAAGAFLFLWRHGREPAAHHGFSGEPVALRSVHGVVRAALGGSALAMIQLGVLAMIATPVARVAFAVVGFAKLRDWRFAGISLVVLALLAAGLFGRS